METSAFVDTTVYNEYVNFKHSIMFPIAIIRFILILAFVGIPDLTLISFQNQYIIV